MASYLIKDTTREERERIVADALGNMDAYCDGCFARLADMYEEYIEGRMELKEVNAAFQARYVKADLGPERGGSCMAE